MPPHGGSSAISVTKEITLIGGGRQDDALILGCVCNHSRIALVGRSPAFAELVIFMQGNADGGLEPVSHLRPILIAAIARPVNAGLD